MIDIATTAAVREKPHATICPLLARVFEALDRHVIDYCLLRGYEELLNGAIDGDLDLLVAADQLGRMRDALAQIGFLALTRWGQTPHHFFIGYDERGDRWIKLDVVTELAYGRPVAALRTALAAECLAHRTRRALVFVPSAEDELLALLLHCLLDKGAIEPAYRARLGMLARAIVDDRAIAAQVARSFPPSLTWDQLRRAIEGGDWDALLKARGVVARHLARRDPIGTRWRRLIRPALRMIDRRTRALRGRGLSVALLAPDGAGKTTLARALGGTFYLPTRYIYMGSNPNSGTLTLPTTRWLARMGRRPVVRALSALNSMIEQGLRYRVAAYHRRRGRLVVFDRYTADALTAEPAGGSPLRRLRRWAMRALCPAPDLVIYLDAPAEVLYERKREHSPQVLEQQRLRYLQLARSAPRAEIVDAQREPDALRRQVTALIWSQYTLMKF